LTQPLPFAPGSFRFASIPLAQDVDTLQTAIVEQIGQYLWAILHPERKQTVPLDILRQKLITERFMIGIWDSPGVAVAFLSEARQAADAMKATMGEISLLSGTVRHTVTTPHSKQDPEQFRPLLAKVAELQWRLTQPENRLLNRFFEVNRFEQVLSLVHQLHSTATSEKHLEQIASVQHNTELLEVLILSVYATELAHVVAGDALHAVWPEFAVGYYTLAALGTGVAAYLMQPEEGSHKPGRSKRALAVLGVWFLLLIALGGWLGLKAHEEQAAEQHKRESATVKEHPEENPPAKK
jgi:hypothetical protein